MHSSNSNLVNFLKNEVKNIKFNDSDNMIYYQPFIVDSNFDDYSSLFDNQQGNITLINKISLNSMKIPNISYRISEIPQTCNIFRGGACPRITPRSF
jgi:hypothetical protein